METIDKGSATPGNDLVVEVAVKFLNNPRVKDSDLSNKRAFLKKKGLSDDQIEEAIRRANLQASPTRAKPTPARTTRGSYLMRFAWNAAVVGGVAYVAAYMFRWYMLPWFRRDSVIVEQLSTVNSSLTELNGNLTSNLTRLSESSVSMQQSLSEQQNKLEQVAVQLSSLQASGSHSSSLTEIKTELLSIKGLLVNKNQFASPRKESGIPTWQRTTTEQPVEETRNEQTVEETRNATVQNDIAYDMHNVVEESSD